MYIRYCMITDVGKELTLKKIWFLICSLALSPNRFDGSTNKSWFARLARLVNT
jgi:hypothetical protein